MAFALTQSIPPTAEPVSLTELKDWCSIHADETRWNTLLTSLGSSARERVERVGQRQLVCATWVLRLDSFRAPTPWGYWDTILLPRPPLVSVTSVVYVANDGTSTTYAATAYLVDTYTEPGRLMPAYNTVWETTRDVPNAVTVTYVAGYSCPFTANASTNVLTGSGRTFTNGDRVRVSNTGGSLPAGLSTLTDYFVISVSGSTFSLSATSGGSAIDITDAGTGTNFIGVVPEEARTAIKRIAALKFEYREVGDKDGEVELAADRIAGTVWSGTYL